ncbi:MAG: hypothetical protein MUO40_07285 [Anaerolineaceae bacterium]|nr:hypothetical protein [Anaerolineaceae bacterium]
MKLVINDKLIKRNKLIGQITTFGSLAVLGIGLVLAFRQDTTMILLSYVALIIGFIMSQVGIYYTNRFGRSPRFDELVVKNFEKLSNEYSLYVYSSPVPILLAGPCGLWIPIPILASGKIVYEKGKWRQKGGSWMMKAFAQEGIGKPEIDEASNIKDITKYLSAKQVPEDKIPMIHTVFVLLNEKTEIGEISEAPSQIIHLKKLRRLIRHKDRECLQPYSEEEQKVINGYFKSE